MRAVKAKALRRQAQASTTGQPNRRLVSPDRGPLKGCAVNHPATTRAVYRKLKKLFGHAPLPPHQRRTA